jgi:uncharacterized protein
MENRRDFLKKLGGISLSCLSISTLVKGIFADHVPLYETKKNGQMFLRPLGQTGLFTSDISFGAMRLQDPSVAERAIEAGINYFDTAPDYRNGSTEEVLGEAIQGKRDRVIIASKLCHKGTGQMHHTLGTPVEVLIQSVEGSLKRLQTDYLDVLLLHAVGEHGPGLGRDGDYYTPRIYDDTMLEAVARMKRDGKIRYFGLSSHGPNLREVFTTALNAGFFDMFMVAYNYRKHPNLEELVDWAWEAGVGFIGMKTIKGKRYEVSQGRGEIFRQDDGNEEQTAVKWVLTNPKVSSVIRSITSHRQLNQLVEISGETLNSSNPVDSITLSQFLSTNSNDCAIGCSDCLKACPHKIAINDMMRVAYYNFVDDSEEATRLFNQLTKGKSLPCTNCTGVCELHCPLNVPIRQALCVIETSMKTNINYQIGSST